jgi:hypothetical protein
MMFCSGSFARAQQRFNVSYIGKGADEEQTHERGQMSFTLEIFPVAKHMLVPSAPSKVNVCECILSTFVCLLSISSSSTEVAVLLVHVWFDP